MFPLWLFVVILTRSSFFKYSFQFFVLHNKFVICNSCNVTVVSCNIIIYLRMCIRLERCLQDIIKKLHTECSNQMLII
jgi:hypothetical protein